MDSYGLRYLLYSTDLIQCCFFFGGSPANNGMLVSINEVNLRQARLVLGWVTISGFNSQCTDLSRYVTSHPGQINLAISSRVGTVGDDALAARE